MKGTLLLQTKDFLVTTSPRNSGGEGNLIYDTPYAPQAVQASSNSVGNEGHFTLEPETIYPP
jgi:hypothetical protein